MVRTEQESCASGLRRCSGKHGLQIHCLVLIVGQQPHRVTRLTARETLHVGLLYGFTQVLFPLLGLELLCR
ncbi:hypothetical protein AOLI_G00284710 [Acnodon oligacanthus]